MEIAKTKPKNDIRGYQKNGLCNITPQAINIFLNYNDNTSNKKYRSFRFEPYS